MLLEVTPIRGNNEDSRSLAPLRPQPRVSAANRRALVEELVDLLDVHATTDLAHRARSCRDLVTTSGTAAYGFAQSGQTVSR